MEIKSKFNVMDKVYTQIDGDWYLAILYAFKIDCNDHLRPQIEFLCYMPTLGTKQWIHEVYLYESEEKVREQINFALTFHDESKTSDITPYMDRS